MSLPNKKVRIIRSEFDDDVYKFVPGTTKYWGILLATVGDSSVVRFIDNNNEVVSRVFNNRYVEVLSE